MRTALFWAVTQRALVIPYRRFDSIFKGQESPEDGTDRLSRNVCKELPLPLRNDLEERSSCLLRGGSHFYCFGFYETRLCSANFVTNCTDFHEIMAESFIADTESRPFVLPRKERLKIQLVPPSKHSAPRL